MDELSGNTFITRAKVPRVASLASTFANIIGEEADKISEGDKSK